MCGGGAIGGGIGSILGDIAGTVLAPETFGASLALPIALGAGGGALGNVLGSAVTGQQVSPLGVLESAGTGGVGGGLGAGTFSDVAGFLGSAPGATADAAAGLGPSFLGGDVGSVPLGSAAEGAIGGAGSLASGAGDFLGATNLTDTGTFLGAAPSGIGTTTDVTGATGGVGTPAVGTTGGGVAGAGAGTGTTAGATTESITSPFDTSGIAAGTPGSTPDVFAGTPGVGQGGIGGTLETFGQSAPTTTGAGAVPLDPTTFPSTSSIDFSVAGGPGGALSGTGPNAVGGGFSFGDISNWIKANSPLLGAGLGGANILRQLMQPGIDVSGLNAQQMAAYQRLQQLAQQLTGPGGGGQLTPEQEQQFANDLAAVQSGIQGKYASLGMAGSTSQMEDLAAAQAASTAGKANAMSQNLRTGLNAAGMLPQFSTPLLNYQLSQDQQLSEMIARLAAAGLTPAPTA